MKYSAGAILSLLCLTVFMDAQSFAPTVERWGMQEVVVQSSKNHANPFSDVDFRCLFRSGALEYEVEGFFDGNATWVARLMPTEEGEWTFETLSSDPELDGKGGSFTVVTPELGNHGPVVVRNQFHFAYADGTSYFPLGTTLYNWVHRDERLQERTLASLRESPFNKVRFLVFPKWMKFNHVEPPLYPYLRVGDEKFDLERFNPEFFRQIERRLFDLQDLGIEADVILFHPYDKWGFETMTRSQDDAYLHYVIARLAAFRNVWWTMANEWDFMEETKDWDHIFRVVRDLDPYDHLRANHNGHEWYDHGKPWVTHCNIQQQWGELYEIAVESREKYGKPILVDEYSYEGNNGHGWGNISGRQTVRRHWAVTMAGGYASHGETYVQPGDILWWAVGGEMVGESPARLGFLKEIMIDLPYEEMRPAPELVNEGAALAKAGEAYLFLFERIDRRANEPEYPRGKGSDAFPDQEILIEGSGTFAVELIDPWLMKLYPLGETEAGRHTFRSRFFPSLFRITRRAEAEVRRKPEPIQVLLERWSSQEKVY